MSWVVENLCNFFIRGDQRDRHRIVINFPRRRLRKFPVNYSDEMKVVINENVLYAHVHVIEVKRPLAALKNLRIAHDISKYKRAKNSELVTLRAGTLPFECMGD